MKTNSINLEGIATVFGFFGNTWRLIKSPYGLFIFASYDKEANTTFFASSPDIDALSDMINAEIDKYSFKKGSENEMRNSKNKRSSNLQRHKADKVLQDSKTGRKDLRAGRGKRTKKVARRVKGVK